MRPKLTREDLNGAKLIEIANLTYADGFGLLFRAEQWPRLTCLDRTWRTPLRRERFWLVDGNTVADLEEAIARINVPPALTDEELALLALAPTEWTPIRDLRASLAGKLPSYEPSQLFELLRRLTDKGMIEARDRQIRLRPTWREELEPRRDEGDGGGGAGAVGLAVLAAGAEIVSRLA